MPTADDNETVNDSALSTISSSVVGKLTRFGPVSPARNVTDIIVAVKSPLPALPGCAVILK